MIFFFELNGRYTRCELLPLADGTQELVVTPPEGEPKIELLTRSTDVTRRIMELRDDMARDGWWGPLGREI